MKILTIVGARPQFIKAAVVSREIDNYNRNNPERKIQEIIVHTGQHYDANMSDIFFSEMKIPKPDYFLGIGGKNHGAMTGQMMEKIEEVLMSEKPDWVLIYGDTNSTLAGALASKKLHIKVAHVEAGLRSFNMTMPEEINRILADRISDLLFCPTEQAVMNLKKEGFESFNCRVVKTGDVMQDGAIFYNNLARKPAFETGDNFVLCTVHRAENTDDPERLKSIIDALESIADETRVILPLHPRTRKILKDSGISLGRITAGDPLGYLEMVWLLKNCSVVMTDSGGLQKEAFFFKKPCITLRDETEWVELVDNGFNVLAGADKNKILEAFRTFQAGHFNSKFDLNLYGGGNAAREIILSLVSHE